MADVTALARDVRSWAGSWSEDATLAVISHVDDLGQAAGRDLAFLDAVPRLLAAPWRTWVAEVQVQNGGYYQYFWNGYAPIARATAGDFDAMGAVEFAVVQRDAAAAFDAVADRLDALRAAPSPPYGVAGPYQDGLRIEDFSAQDDAWSRAYDDQPVIDLIGAWLAQRTGEIADAILAT
ncbi:MAG: DUF4375 domain-containing protein [Streptosporangiaceae bacterium]|nr:DUF4375 domain-containing protein [Streptosporangiaceae bacterium]